MTFKDLDRNTRLTGTVYPSEFTDSPAYIIKNLELTNGGCTTWSPDDLSCQRKHIERLFLHTWDKDHISGYTKWQDNNYGLAFSSGGLTTRQGDGFNASNWIQEWTGTYKGSQDGRDARLVIERNGSNLEIIYRGMERNQTFRTNRSINSSNSVPKYVLEDLRLTNADGQSKHIERLFLHTWNTNYISGYSRWSGNNYGNYYVRTGN